MATVSKAMQTVHSVPDVISGVGMATVSKTIQTVCLEKKVDGKIHHGQCLIAGVVQSFKSNAIFVIKGAEVKAVSRMSHHVRGCLFEVMKVP